MKRRTFILAYRKQLCFNISPDHKTHVPKKMEAIIKPANFLIRIEESLCGSTN